jgi:hypothetical protein
MRDVVFTSSCFSSAINEFIFISSFLLPQVTSGVAFASKALLSLRDVDFTSFFAFANAAAGSLLLSR